MNSNKINLYFDMDGVLADFYATRNAVDRFREEENFFYNLPPMNSNAFKQLLNNARYNIFIISASPHAKADNDKRKWLRKYYPQLKEENIVIMRIGEKKVDYMLTKNGILFDDYGKNCREWLSVEGNKSIKVDRPLEELIDLI